MKDLILLNDFESCAFSLPTLDSESYIPLVAKEKAINLNKDNFRCLLVGPGTGYGMSLVYRA